MAHGPLVLTFEFFFFSKPHSHSQPNIKHFFIQLFFKIDIVYLFMGVGRGDNYIINLVVVTLISCFFSKYW